MVTMLGEALLLGLSTGTYCAASCAPVLLPFLFSETGTKDRNSLHVLLFMLGRLAGYVFIGAMLGLTGTLAVDNIPAYYHGIITAFANMSVGMVMLVTGIFYFAGGSRLCHAIRNRMTPRTNAVILGILTGINICPPFLAAAARVLEYRHALNGILYFLFFYIGTSVFMLPLFGIPLVGKHLNEIRIVARITTIVLGAYFLVVVGLPGLLRLVLRNS
jgi:sulfite exporter TauE/SafE